MNKFNRVAMMALIASAALTSGCASIIDGSKQQVHINSYDAATNTSVVANCTVSNDEGSFRTASNRSVIVQKDKDLLNVECESDELKGQAMIDGSINGGYIVANALIDFCTVSCLIDGISGSWAKYPTMIDVPMDSKINKKVPLAVITSGRNPVESEI